MNQFQKSQSAKILASYISQDSLEKGGEGSRGGIIIGHTKTGLPVYNTFLHNSRNSTFKREDHRDAAKLLITDPRESGTHSYVADFTPSYNQDFHDYLAEQSQGNLEVHKFTTVEDVEAELLKIRDEFSIEDGFYDESKTKFEEIYNINPGFLINALKSHYNEGEIEKGGVGSGKRGHRAVTDPVKGKDHVKGLSHSDIEDYKKLQVKWKVANSKYNRASDRGSSGSSNIFRAINEASNELSKIEGEMSKIEEKNGLHSEGSSEKQKQFQKLTGVRELVGRTQEEDDE